MRLVLCMMQSTACSSHVAVAWHFDGVTNLTQSLGAMGSSLLYFGQFSVLNTLIEFGSLAFHVDDA